MITRRKFKIKTIALLRGIMPDRGAVSHISTGPGHGSNAVCGSNLKRKK